MVKQIIVTDRAPRAIGPYSQAVKAGSWVFVSGQIPLGRDGNLAGTTIEEQTRVVLENLGTILRAAGSSLDRVVKTTVYLADLADFAAMNQVYGSYFPEASPARATVQVAGLPRGVRVEIDAIAMA